jgi:hypothetical protein
VQLNRAGYATTSQSKYRKSHQPPEAVLKQGCAHAAVLNGGMVDDIDILGVCRQVKHFMTDYMCDLGRTCTVCSFFHCYQYKVLQVANTEAPSHQLTSHAL